MLSRAHQQSVASPSIPGYSLFWWVRACPLRVCTSRVKGVLAAERPDGGHSEAGGAGAVAGLGRAEDGDGAGQVLQEGAVCQWVVYVPVVFL